VKFEFVMAVKMWTVVLWTAMPCGLVGGFQGYVRRLSGVMVSVLAIGPKVRRFK
jgi:hypothetical protein